MLIRTLTRASGRLTWAPGQIVEIDSTEAQQLIQAGAAIAIKSTPQVPPPVVQVAIPAVVEVPPPVPKRRKK